VLIYGTKIVPLLKVKTTTTKTTISACQSFKSFIVAPIGLAESYRDEVMVALRRFAQPA
jgi:hypothetical protein